MSDGLRNDNTRKRLMAEQNGLCRYCERKMATGSKELVPVLEHFRPRTSGGKRADLVLACASCDKMKGMIHGDEFLAIIRQETIEGRSFMQVRARIMGAAKKENVRLQAELRIQQQAANRAKQQQVDERRRHEPGHRHVGQSESAGQSKLAELLRPLATREDG